MERLGDEAGNDQRHGETGDSDEAFAILGRIDLLPYDEWQPSL